MRSSLTGAMTGVVVLAALVGFAVGLPEAVGDDEGATGPSPSELLPDELADGLLPISERDDPNAGLYAEQEKYGADRLTEVFGGEVATRLYSDGQVSVTLTVAEGEPGLFIPFGPPYDAELAGQEAPTYDLVEADDAICWVYSGAAEQQAQTGGVPLQVECQRGYQGLTIDAISTGLTAEQTVAALDQVTAEAESE